MRTGFGWLAALILAFGAAGGASAATLPPTLSPPLRGDAPPMVAAPPASFASAGSESTRAWEGPPEPATVMLLATGLGGLALLGRREFA